MGGREWERLEKKREGRWSERKREGEGREGERELKIILNVMPYMYSIIMTVPQKFNYLQCST